MNQVLKKNLKPTTFRLTPLARHLLTLLSERKGISRTAVLETLIREEARREKIG